MTRAEFIDRVLTSSFPGQVAKRFSFPDGEVGALYTMGRKPTGGQVTPVILYVATFPPSQQQGVHDFGIDYFEQPVATPEEAHYLLAQFEHEQARQFRAGCRPQAGPAAEPGP